MLIRAHGPGWKIFGHLNIYISHTTLNSANIWLTVHIKRFHIKINAYTWLQNNWSGPISLSSEETFAFVLKSALKSKIRC